ncbi:hypothetical protein FE275_24290 [Pseudomonas koreensis]|nr:hypothetical protein FE275_24290 [Pseudomonas koreensis]
MANRITNNQHKTNVGASLLAKGAKHSARMLNEKPLSRAGSLPQVQRRVRGCRGRRSAPDSAPAYRSKSAGTGQSAPA